MILFRERIGHNNCMNHFVVKSFAKINIGLNVVCTRPDGYHELDSIMVPLELHDSLLFSTLGSNSLESYVTVDHFSITDSKQNIVTKTLNLLDEEYGLKNKFRVIIHKNVPMQGGFGGGSSNAAATLLAMNDKYNLRLSREQILSDALKLGADVPFFIDLTPCRAKGRGEVLTPITIKNNYYVLVVVPSKGCPTKDVFKACDNLPLQHVNIDAIQEALETGNNEMLEANLANSLQAAAETICPEISAVINELKSYGLNSVFMTGSGSGVIALSLNKLQLIKIAKKLEDRYLVEVTRIKR